MTVARKLVLAHACALPAAGAAQTAVTVYSSARSY